MWAKSFVVEKRTESMDASSSLEALAFDPSKCSKLSMEKKRELVYELSKWTDGATELLHSWSRQEILQILCAELGKERKYTGLTKSKIIEHLLKIIDEKKSTANASESHPPSENGERTPKRQRKSDHPNRLPVASNSSAATSAYDADVANATYCKNSACKAKLNRGDSFCKRCSCCICRQYDDNKDPSLWLICNSDPPFHGISCGMSCHLECALKHENSGISKDRQDKGLDGSFCCVSCGKVNDLLGSWRKQLVEARDTRRVDILCYRLSLAQKILAGTKHYQNLCGDVDKAVEMLEEEVGPLTGLPVKKARGIVNRLSSGPEIQRLCASAVESVDMMLSERMSDTPSECNVISSKHVRFEDVHSSSITVVLNCDDINARNFAGYNLWHRKAGDTEYPVHHTCRLLPSSTKFLLSNLTPATDYFLKVSVIFDKDRETGFSEFQFRTENSQNDLQNPKNLEVERSQSPATNCSSLSNPSSVEDETNNLMPSGNEANNRGDNYLPFTNNNSDKSSATNLLGKNTTTCSDPSHKETNGDVISLLDEEHNIPHNDQSNFRIKEPSKEMGMQITLYKSDNVKDGADGSRNKRGKGKDVFTEEPQAGSSSKKRSGERIDEECAGIGDKDFEYYVKEIRRLECDGHIETEFRQKFLTWYSLRATPQQVRIVKVFVDTFVEDPECLAGQLLDTFSEVVANKRCSTVPAGFCMKLWH